MVHKLYIFLFVALVAAQAEDTDLPTLNDVGHYLYELLLLENTLCLQVLAELAAEAPVENVETKLTAFYEDHNPEKMGDVPKLLKKFAGREEAMFKALEEKYVRVWGSNNGDVKHLRDSTFDRFTAKPNFEKVTIIPFLVE